MSTRTPTPSRRTATGRATPAVTAITRAWLRRHPLPEPGADSDKDGRGRVLVVGGAVPLPGAIVLAGVAALRAGAGKLQLATCRSLTASVGTAVPEALVIPLGETRAGGIAPAGAAEIVRRAHGMDALLVGPGMLDQPAVDTLVTRLLDAAARQPLARVMVLDAAALVSLARPAIVRRMRRAQTHVIVTPHAGEMATMLAVPRDDVETDPRGIAESAAARLGATVVLKGAVTHVAAPGMATRCYTGGDVGLATSGSGDTLAGVIAGLAARGADPALAASWGVYLHGEAGNVLARGVGRIGFLARELLDAVPRAMRGVG